MSFNDYFSNNELLPAIIVQDSTDEVLMLAYMNAESLRKTIESGYTWFYSRSRGCLWNKGETSGNTQKVLSITGDCDMDAAIIRVEQKGDACHTGRRSCFFNEVWSADDE